MEKKEYNKQYHIEHREEINEDHRKYYYKNKDYFKKKQKEWRDKNPEHLKELKRNSYLRNREKTIAHINQYRAKNLNKIKAYHKERYKNNPELFKERRLKYNYGMTFEDKEEIYKQQEGKCKICLNDFQIHELHIDHSHKTNIIRGLLCPHCNTAIGLLKEDTNILKSAIKYLENCK